MIKQGWTVHVGKGVADQFLDKWYVSQRPPPEQYREGPMYLWPDGLWHEYCYDDVTHLNGYYNTEEEAQASLKKYAPDSECGSHA